MRSWMKIPLFWLLAIIGIVGWRYLLGSELLRFGANAAPEQPSTRVLVYGYMITLVGVVLGSIYRELQTRKQRGDTSITSLRSLLASVFLSLDFWMSLCGSPLVYALIWKSMEGGNLAGLSTIALQNGFCCTVIIGSLISKPAQTPTTS
jgi:hypothetical protein